METIKPAAAPGSGLIKAGGILLIIFSALGVLAGPLSIVGGTAHSSPEMAAFLPAGQTSAMAESAIRAGAIMTATSVVSLIGGILAVRFCSKVQRRRLCMIAAIVLMVCQLASEAVLAFYGEFDLLSAAFRLVFPLLVFAGSVRGVPAVSIGSTSRTPAAAPALAVSGAPSAALTGSASSGESGASAESASPALPDASGTASADQPAEN